MLDTEKILCITTTAVKGFSVRGGEVKELVNLSWTPDTIGRVLETVRAAIGRNVRVLVGEPFSYVATLVLPEKESYASPKEEREAVLRSAGRLIPEDLAHMSWDYREVAIPSLGGRCVQVVALVASFARVVAGAVKSAGFRVSLTLPESCALASRFADREEPILLVSREEGFFVAGVFGGIVLSSVTSLGVLTNESVESMARFLKHRFDLSPQKIIFVGSFSNEDFESFDRDSAERSGFIIEFSNTNGRVALAEEKNIDGDDCSTLSLDLLTLEKDSASSEREVCVEKEGDSYERFRSHTLDERTSAERGRETGFSKRFPTRTRIMAVIFLAMLLLGAGAIFLLKRYD